MVKPQKKDELDKSQDMKPVAGTVEIDVPVETLWACFSHPNLWNEWNECFWWAKNKELELGNQLIWVFQPIKWWYPYKMPAIAKIVEFEPRKKVTWEVSALPGFYALHTYHMERLGENKSRFGSWEKAMGWNFRMMKCFWISHFTFVKEKSLRGAQYLEKVYRSTGELSEQALQKKIIAFVNGINDKIQ